MTGSDREKEPLRKGRRGFLAGLLAFLAGILPPMAGLGVLLDPLRRREGGLSGQKVRIATLDSLPADGRPRRFPVVARLEDAWNRRDNVPVGAVFLRRLGDRQVEAFSVSCPHAGCFVVYRAGDESFLCPCHNSVFALDGSIQGSSPSPRGLDTLEVDRERLEEDGEIWVTYLRFRAGTPDKVAL